MPRLVRLTTNDTQCRFRAKFGQGFKLRKNGRVALKNATISLNPKVFEINDHNNGIIWNADAGVISDRLGVIPPGTYSVANIDSLYSTITNVMNDATGFPVFTATKEFGLEWKMATDPTTKKTKLEYKIANFAGITSSMRLYGNAAYDSGTNSIGLAITGTASAALNKYACRGGLAYALDIESLSSTATTDPVMYVGLSEKNPDSTSAYTVADIKYGIGIREAGQDYVVISNGIAQVPVLPDTVASGDTVFINKYYNSGRATAVYALAVYSSSGIIKTVLDGLASPALTAETLYPVLVITTAGNSLSNIGYTQSPFIDSLDATLAQRTVVGDVPDQPQISATNNYIEFESTDLSSILGFDSNRIPVSGFTSATLWSVIATNITNAGLKGNSLIIELENLPIDRDWETIRIKPKNTR
jgi:hypothetical protein